MEKIKISGRRIVIINGGNIEFERDMGDEFAVVLEGEDDGDRWYRVKSGEFLYLPAPEDAERQIKDIEERLNDTKRDLEMLKEHVALYK